MGVYLSVYVIYCWIYTMAAASPAPILAVDLTGSRQGEQSQGEIALGHCLGGASLYFGCEPDSEPPGEDRARGLSGH